MENDVHQLVGLLVGNGFEVTVTAGADYSLITVLHCSTDRESVFGFDALTKQEVMDRIAEQLCTEPQRCLLAEARERSFHDLASCSVVLR